MVAFNINREVSVNDFGYIFFSLIFRLFLIAIYQYIRSYLPQHDETS